MFLILVTTIIGNTHTSTVELPTRYPSLEVCNRAIPRVAHGFVPDHGELVAFRCIREDGV